MLQLGNAGVRLVLHLRAHIVLNVPSLMIRVFTTETIIEYYCFP